MFVRQPNGNSSVSSDPGERYIRVPEHGVSNSSSYEMSAASAVSSPLQPSVAAGGYPSVFPAVSELTSSKESGDDNGEPYIRLEDCYSGPPVDVLPVYSASHGGQIVSPNEASKQVCSSASVDVGATNRFADCSRHKVEYCNEYELGEHESMFVSVNSNYNYVSDAGGECKSDDDDDDDKDDKDYCHYKYPTVRYSLRQSMLSQLSEPRSITERRVGEPHYVNCSYVTDFKRNCGREMCPGAHRHHICHGSVVTDSELQRLFYEPSSSGRSLPLSSTSHRSVGTYSSDSWNSCRFYPCHEVTSISEAFPGDGDDDVDDDAHSYVNVPH